MSSAISIRAQINATPSLKLQIHSVSEKQMDLMDQKIKKLMLKHLPLEDDVKRNPDPNAKIIESRYNYKAQLVHQMSFNHAALLKGEALTYSLKDIVEHAEKRGDKGIKERLKGQLASKEYTISLTIDMEASQKAGSLVFLVLETAQSKTVTEERFTLQSLTYDLSLETSKSPPSRTRASSPE